ncbi:MAG: ABC transporter permease [Paracoccaceae bacterium]|nr:ABC transporter permease [Paracoccaceae bacterium]
MSTAGSQSSRRTVVSVIAWREAKATMRGISGYAAITIALIVATWILLVDVRALEAGGHLVLADPFGPPLTIAMLVLALFLAVSAAVSAARDRESGTLEVLFYGPVDEISYVLGKIGGLLLAYLAALPLLLASLSLLALMTGFSLTLVIVASLILSIVPAAEIVGFGVLLSIGTNRVRTAVLLLIGITVVLLGITVAYSMVLLIPIEDPSSPVLPLRDVLAALDAGVRWISPFAYLERVVDAAVTGAWRTALISLAVAVAYTAVMICLAAYWMRRRGVHRRGE